MGDSEPSRKRSRSSRGKLRRFHDVESVIVEEPFSLFLPSSGDAPVGDGCYVSATMHRRRFYGVLVDQAALKEASMLWFKDEASSLDLNRRMKLLKEQHDEQQDEDSKKPAVSKTQASKQQEPQPDEAPSSSQVASAARSESVFSQQQVQKFRYVESGDSDGLGYRVLLATYANVDAASEDNADKAEQIEQACRRGGDFVGNYYYQYEVLSTTLKTSEKPIDVDGMRTSMGMETFLHNTLLPSWFPLSNLEGGQKILSLLNMKKDNSGNVVWDKETAEKATEGISMHGTHVPMEERSFYRVGVIGGGIAGLACCSELLRLCKEEGIDVEVVLLEARSRLGGRLWTDRETFKFDSGDRPFPVDLGASFIHGIEHNPLASLANQAGVEFVKTVDKVKMMKENMQEVDEQVDEKMGALFDELLDLAADDCWTAEQYAAEGQRNQKAVRWYASAFSGTNGEDAKPEPTDTKSHRYSSDISINHAIGRAIARYKFNDFAKLSKEEHRMLLWSMKNTEYALGANISDLSMKYWDSDERHAFEGDHVLLRQGYTAVVDHMVKRMETRGDRFVAELNFPVSRIEYARKSTTSPYPGSAGRSNKLVELSDTCCVTSEDGKRNMKFDFVVCTAPLGVLKESIAGNSKTGNPLSFVPPLPYSKRDAIETAGFGLLNKVFVQFPSAFWRNELEGDQTLFGNTTDTNPHHYMFCDIGKSLGKDGDAPAVLMSLISGKEAVDCERLTDQQLAGEVTQTLRTIFSGVKVPDPIAYKTTRWGQDRFSRGSYTFLPPGATDQDFQLLQAPVNGNGDSILLDGTETMRLFFAGEHTTALHPSVAHGAMLSGIRAAKDVLDTMKFAFQDKGDVDRVIPISLFRRKCPDAELKCAFCHLAGSTIREGSLMAFKRGARQVLGHNNCAENSPEVEVSEGRWRNVIKAVNRGKLINCVLCGLTGATIGCTHVSCFRCFHFGCSEDTGWRFERDGKVYYCEDHREESIGGECDLVSLSFYRLKHPGVPMTCCLCTRPEEAGRQGKLLAFQRKKHRLLVHVNCARYTNIVDTTESDDSTMDFAFRNIFEAAELAKPCTKCGRDGATVSCTETTCGGCYHYTCSEETGWNFKGSGRHFRCVHHRVMPSSSALGNSENGLFQHALFSRFGGGAPNVSETPKQPAPGMPSNHDMGGTCEPAPGHNSGRRSEGASDEILVDHQDELEDEVMTRPLDSERRLGGKARSKVTVQAQRDSVKDPWSLVLNVVPVPSSGVSVLCVDISSIEGLRTGDVIISVDGIRVGSSHLPNLKKVLECFRKGIKVVLEVQREAHDANVTE